MAFLVFFLIYLEIKFSRASVQIHSSTSIEKNGRSDKKIAYRSSADPLKKFVAVI
mgnify:CR=1 FL=1